MERGGGDGSYTVLTGPQRRRVWGEQNCDFQQQTVKARQTCRNKCVNTERIRRMKTPIKAEQIRKVSRTQSSNLVFYGDRHKVTIRFQRVKKVSYFNRKELYWGHF